MKTGSRNPHREGRRDVTCLSLNSGYGKFFNDFLLYEQKNHPTFKVLKITSYLFKILHQNLSKNFSGNWYNGNPWTVIDGEWDVKLEEGGKNWESYGTESKNPSFQKQNESMSLWLHDTILFSRIINVNPWTKPRYKNR